MIGYRFLSPAEDEMTEAALFYESVGLGNDFLDDVQQRIDTLCQYLKSGTLIDTNLRRTLLHRFPFSMIYAEEPDAILIVSIAHQRKRPGSGSRAFSQISVRILCFMWRRLCSREEEVREQRNRGRHARYNPDTLRNVDPHLRRR